MSTNSAPDPAGYVFGPFRLDLVSRQVFQGEQIVPMTARVFDTLLLLIRRAGQLVEKDELLDQVWPDSHVSEDSVTQSISALRRALGEDPAQPGFITTVPRRGYRFTGPVTVQPAEVTRGTVAAAPDGAVTVTGCAVSAMVRRVIVSSRPNCLPLKASSSRSGSFISQWARRRSNSVCGPPPS